MNLLQDKTVRFDDNETCQQNQKTPSPPRRPHMIGASSSIGDGLDHMRLPFAYKLHILLCDMETKGCEHVISWVKEGKAFKIHDRTTFETLIQPHYFRQSKIASFIRQCYMYGFSKIERGPNQGSYVHPDFCKDDQEKSLTIQRHSSTRADHKRKNTPSTPLPKHIANPAPGRNTSSMAAFSTMTNHAYTGVSSSCQTWQYPSSTTGHLTGATDSKRPIRVDRQLTALPNSCSVVGPLNAIDLRGGVHTHHKQAQNFH